MKDKIEMAMQTTLEWLERLRDIMKPRHKDKIEKAVQSLQYWLDSQLAEEDEYEAKLKEHEGMLNSILTRKYIQVYLHNDDKKFMGENFNEWNGCECQWCGKSDERYQRWLDSLEEHGHDPVCCPCRTCLRERNAFDAWASSMSGPTDTET